jgi:hypothetical protein
MSENRVLSGRNESAKSRVKRENVVAGQSKKQLSSRLRLRQMDHLKNHNLTTVAGSKMHVERTPV